MPAWAIGVRGKLVIAAVAICAAPAHSAFFDAWTSASNLVDLNLRAKKPRRVS